MGEEIEIHRTNEQVYATVEDISARQRGGKALWAVRSYDELPKPMRASLLGDELTALALWWLRRPENADTLLRLVAETLGLTVKQARQVKNGVWIRPVPTPADEDEADD